jgi:flagellar basal-body rod modification protein FlgD
MSIAPIGSSTSATGTTSGAGIGALSSSDFMNLMLTQLEQQDPLNPTDSNQMLSQLSQISNLQANNAMQTSLQGLQTNLQGLTLQQSIGAGGNLIGKSITGTASDGTTNVTGVVNSVQVQNNNVYLGLANSTEIIPMSSVTSISTAPTTLSSSLAMPSLVTASTPTALAAPTTTTAATPLQSIIAGLAGL